MPRHPAIAPSFLLLLWIAFTIFGSWYPFVFQKVNVLDALTLWLNSIHHYKPKTDIIINTLLGVPTGVFSHAFIVRFLIRYKNWRLARFWQVLVGILVCLFAACFVEIGQIFFAGRDPSIWDSVCQVCGSLIGVMAIVLGFFDLESSIEKVGSVYRQLDLIERTFGFLVFVFIIFQLWPFIPTLSPSELKQKISAIQLTTESGSLRNTPATLQLDGLAEGLSLFVLSVISGFTVGRIGKRIFRISWLPRCLISFTFAPGVELAKLFIEDRMPSVAALGICFMGSIFGGFASYLTPDR